jgi:hypothetical protein
LIQSAKQKLVEHNYEEALLILQSAYFVWSIEVTFNP